MSGFTDSQRQAERCAARMAKTYRHVEAVAFGRKGTARVIVRWHDGKRENATPRKGK